jgi:hypothetical protein
MALWLVNKERTLLLNSQVTEEYPWFYEFLESNPKITVEIVDALPPDKKDFCENIVPKIKLQATEEWKGNPDHPVDDLGEDRIPCSLCGQPNKWIFYIVNQLNNKELNVGSDCVTHFGIDTGRPGFTVDQLVKGATRIRLLNKLNKRFSGIDAIVAGWDRALNTYPIIIPLSLEKPYQELGDKVKKLYEEYLSGMSDEEEFSELDLLLKTRQEIVQKIDTYVKENVSDKFIPRRNILNYVDRELLKKIQLDGRLTWGTLYRIAEPGLMKSIIPELNVKLHDIGMEIEKADTERVGYVIKIHSRNDSLLFCKYRKFLLDFGCLLFNEDPIGVLNIERIMAISSVYDEYSHDRIIQEIAAILNKGNIEISSSDYENNEIVIYERPTNKYLILALKEFVERFKGLGVPLEEITSYIAKLPNKRYSKEELADLQSVKRSLNKAPHR